MAAARKPSSNGTGNPTKTSKAVRKAAPKAPAAARSSQVRARAKSRATHADAPPRDGGRTDLVIVESPTKARVIAPLLGRGYLVRASVGHVRDLPTNQLGVAAETDFAPLYVVPPEKMHVVDELRVAARNASIVYLATDPDREGEAISWHLVEAAGIKDRPVRRVVFHEITPEAIREAFLHPRDIDMDLVDAQQARRVLDRLVGYTLSPLLGRKIRRGLSAGRVQSVALRIIIEREREIVKFLPDEYWSIDADLGKLGEAAGDPRRGNREGTFRAGLVNLVGKRGRIPITNEAEADRLAAELRPAAYKVKSLTAKTSSRQPEPPFTTSTLQQEAARKLNFTAQRTMSVAQQLYEGMDIGEENAVGLITYMRTDSVRMAESAIEQTRQYIQRAYGGDFVPSKPRQFTTRSKGAQEAHEAIRPTAAVREPETLRARLTPEQFRLYDLIWKRAVASQMAAASLENESLDVEAHNPASGNTYLLRATHTRVTFPGYQVLYIEGSDSDDDEEAQRAARLPQVAEGEALELQELVQKQHFTQPPPRYSDASLVKALEANGIGRPSTYAATLGTIQERGYARKEKRQYVPQEVGYLVNDLLTEHFPEVVDIGFTAKMEGDLDDIAAGSRPWVPVVRDFYGPFSRDVQRANSGIAKIAMTQEPTGEQCDKCGRPMIYRQSRFGRFQSCSGFPNCRNAKPVLVRVGVLCPKDGGDLIEKRTKRGRIFYGCANFPACDFTTWERPIPGPCPACGGLQVQARAGSTKCTQCGHTTAGVPGRRRGADPEESPEEELAAAQV